MKSKLLPLVNIVNDLIWEKYILSGRNHIFNSSKIKFGMLPISKYSNDGMQKINLK